MRTSHATGTSTSNRRALRLALLAALVVGLAACSGGSSGGGSTSSGSPLIVAIRLINVPDGMGNFNDIEIWSESAGSTPNPPTNISLNGIIEFEFAGNVASTSLPQGGIAVGTINITSPAAGGGTFPAAGTFAVLDAPNAPAGNARIVQFAPTPPTSQASPTSTSGLAPNSTYTVFVPRTGNSTQVLNVAGAPLANDAAASFDTCDAAGPLGPAGCFTDPVAGAPYVVMTTPASNDPSPAPIDPTTIANNTVSIFVSEPLFPTGINVQNVRLIDMSSGAQVPGAVQFFQLGTPAAGPSTSRIDYVATSQLLSNVTYEIEIDPAVADFGGFPVSPYDPNDPTAPASGRRFIQTIAVPFCPQPVFSESFDSVANRGSVTGIASWDGSGAITSSFPFELTGGGSYGDLTFAPGPQTLDTGMPAMTGYQDGNFDVLNLNVQAGSAVRAEGTYRVHIRCLGSATVSGTLNANAGTNPTAVPGSVNQGPGSGAFNNGGNPTNSVVRGGVAGTGGGNGGRASQDGFMVRTPEGETGFGPTINGMPNTGPFGNDPTYGGGRGGVGGFRFPAGGMPGDLGGLGGAGGSAWEPGGDGQPYVSPAMGCTPTLPQNQPISAATPIPVAMIAPVSIASAGSGGGGGGDRFELTGPTNDDQGAGGSGGGGGIRISSVLALDVVAGATITANGAGGGTGNLFFAGGGGGGSGGEIWLQSFTALNISPSSTMTVSGGAAANTCSDHASGAGGFGLYQLEDPSGMPGTSFIPAGGGTGGANIIALQFPFDATTTTGTATSIFFDTGYGAPDYDPGTVVETTSLGANPPAGASVIVEYQGAFEALSGGQPDLGTLSSWVSGANLDQLDGRRFIRFRATISIPTPNAAGTGTLPTNTLPTVDQVSFGFSSPNGCAP